MLSEIGSFGGLFRLDRERYREPVLVSSADGVGTKLKVAFMTGRHDTVGADLVNHCVNDILVQGAEPLFFLDYLATGRLSPDVAEQVVAGVARGCRENGCALIGGETAEMPGFYADGEYDIAGFIVGVVERSRGRSTAARSLPGDVLIGLPSAGLHTNGYSLARQVLFEIAGWTPDTFVPELGATVGDALLAPHRSYLQLVRPLLDARPDQGDGAHHRRRHHRESAARAARGLRRGDRPAVVDGAAAVHAAAGSAARIATDEMFRAFNMGIGLIVIVCAARDAQRVVNLLSQAGEPNAFRLGFVVAGERRCGTLSGRRLRPSGERSRDSLNRTAARPSSSPAAGEPAVDHRRHRRPAGSTRRSRWSSRTEPDAAGLQRARDAGIEALCLNPRDYPDRDAYDAALAETLVARDVDLVCLAGFMRLVGAAAARRLSATGSSISTRRCCRRFPDSTRSVRRSSTAFASPARPCIS